jgi:hypothetical protein
MSGLEEFLQGKPLNERIKRLMAGEEDDADEVAAEETTTAQRNISYADGVPLTDNDRRHLERLTTTHGWQVLLKLLDTELRHREDAAIRDSLCSPLTRKDEIVAGWAELVADQKARHKIVALIEAEVEVLKAKKRQCDSGTTKTPTAAN